MKWVLFIYVLFLLSGCRQQPSSQSESGKDSLTKTRIEETDLENEEVIPSVNTSYLISTKSKTALFLDSLGFINIAETDSSITIELIYTRANNFTGQVLYQDLKEAYLHPDAMESLSKAQHLLKELHPDYSLIVYDAARPMSVQQKMWDVVKGTSKQIYVSNPARGGGLHNYGLAVDISILDEQGSPLSMGTPVDYLGKEAHITEEAQLVKSGKITEQERENRLLLRRIMKDAGFRPLPSEWWHFNRYNRQTAKEKYQVIP